MSSEPVDPRPQVAAAITRAERRRAMLERFAEMGMTYARAITARATDGRVADPKRDPAGDFAQVSKAVRFALILETRLDAQILASRKDGLRALEPPTPALRRRPSRPDAAREMLEDALDREFDEEEAEELEDELESLGEREDFEDLLVSGDFRACVASICADLGLDPDWSCWTEEEGFIRDDGAPVTDWVSRFG